MEQPQCSRVVSSTYFQMFVFATLRSLIIIRNNQGPSLIPWGTPAGTARHSDTQPQLNFTFCLLFVRKSKIQHMIDSRKSYEESFWARTWWSIKSKALRKSNSTSLVIAPFRSVNSNQECYILISTCVVEDLGTAPNCWGSILSSTAGLT